MNGLTRQDRELWHQVIQDVKPLSDYPVSPNEHQYKMSATLQHRPRVSHSLDLHGLPIQEAYLRALEHVENAKGTFRHVTIITGLSGQINVEFPRWFENHHLVRSIKPLNGGGAWEICLKKSST